MSTSMRECTIVDVPLLLRIAHGHLDPAYRVETASESREKISVSLSVYWTESHIDSFEQLFNYASLYRILQSMHDRVVTGPLEGVIDELETAVIAAAKEQGIAAIRTAVTLRRPDLLHGHVQLSKTTDHP